MDGQRVYTCFVAIKLNLGLHGGGEAPRILGVSPHSDGTVNAGRGDLGRGDEFCRLDRRSMTSVGC